MLNFIFTHTPLLYLTQSLWRDEAFSILVAEKPLLSVLGKLSVEPPVYYILLHFWIKIFGNSEVATRSLSFLGFILTLVIVIIWAEKLFKKSWLAWFLPIFFFLNPMLLYYAFEVRTYGWYIFFATASFYAYLEKKWFYYVIVTTLGFYTHTFFGIVPLVQTVHFIIFNLQLILQKNLRKLASDSFVRAIFLFGLLIFPWIIRVVVFAKKFKDSWYFPVDFHLIKSVLGNMFIGYEGTPWYLWSYTTILSLFLLLAFCLTLTNRQHFRRNLFFFLMVFLPLTLVISVSFIKPLFVNRYLIAVSIAEIFLFTFALETIKNRFLQFCLAGFALVAVFAFNLWYPGKHAKLSIRQTVNEINLLRTDKDIILTDSPLIFFETLYYSNDRNRVYFYNPRGGAFPWYVGDAIFSADRMLFVLPVYPNRAFLIHVDNTFEIVYQLSIK